VTIVAISCDLTIIQIKSQNFQIKSQIESVFQIKSFHLKSNQQNGSNRDLNPNSDWDLPITVIYLDSYPLTYSADPHRALLTSIIM